MRLAVLIAGSVVGLLLALWFVFFWVLASKLPPDGAVQR